MKGGMQRGTSAFVGKSRENPPAPGSSSETDSDSEMIAFLSSTSVQENYIAFVFLFLSLLVIIDYVGRFGIINLQIRCVGGKVDG